MKPLMMSILIGAFLTGAAMGQQQMDAATLQRVLGTMQIQRNNALDAAAVANARADMLAEENARLKDEKKAADAKKTETPEH